MINSLSARISFDLLSAGVILLILTFVVCAVAGNPPEYLIKSSKPSFLVNSYIDELYTSPSS